jgi:hypothetical protein
MKLLGLERSPLIRPVLNTLAFRSVLHLSINKRMPDMIDRSREIRNCYDKFCRSIQK